jgi:hypothetical protein
VYYFDHFEQAVTDAMFEGIWEPVTYQPFIQWLARQRYKLNEEQNNSTPRPDINSESFAEKVQQIMTQGKDFPIISPSKVASTWE